MFVHPITMHRGCLFSAESLVEVITRPILYHHRSATAVYSRDNIVLLYMCQLTLMRFNYNINAILALKHIISIFIERLFFFDSSFVLFRLRHEKACINQCNIECVCICCAYINTKLNSSHGGNRVREFSSQMCNTNK